MSSVTFYLPDGTSRSVDVPAGWTLMQAAVKNDVPGIVAECGGNAMCATCHVYIDAGGDHDLPDISDVEEEMLDCTVAPRTQESRLSCQLTLDVDWGHISVRVPDRQL
jgi:ferredoxin, 2Fe-2S